MINKIISLGTFEAMNGIREGKNTLREVDGIIADAFYKKNEENIKNVFGANLEILKSWKNFLQMKNIRI